MVWGKPSSWGAISVAPKWSQNSTLGIEIKILILWEAKPYQFDTLGANGILWVSNCDRAPTWWFGANHRVKKSWISSLPTWCFGSLGPLPLASDRWLQTVKLMRCKFSDDSKSACMFRRLQMSEQQAERQRKNCLQKALIFDVRANEIMLEDLSRLLHCFQQQLFIFSFSDPI